jgi:hypothetical protein
VLQKATEALALHAQQSLESITSESVYSDPGIAPESLDGAEPDDASECEKASEVVGLTSKPVGLSSEPVDLPVGHLFSDPAAESLQVERPLSPVAGTYLIHFVRNTLLMMY